MSANVESMFYVGDMPWHKEGKALEKTPTTKEAIECAGLNWNVEKVNLFTKNNDLIDNYFGIMRCDNGKILGVVRKGYTPLQNSEAFNVFDPLISSEFLEYETAGSLGDGEIIWILAKIKASQTFKVINDDNVNKYLLLSNSHDGQSAVSMKFTPIRVVCQNTLNIALSEGETTRIKHLTTMKKKLEDVQIAVGNICRVYSGVEELFKKMAQYSMKGDKAKEYFNQIYPVLDEKTIKNESQYIKRINNIKIQEQLLKNFECGFGVKELKIGGTLWAAYNAITQYIDHPIDYKLGDNKLLKRIWFGDGEVIKKRAYIKASDYLKVA